MFEADDDKGMAEFWGKVVKEITVIKQRAIRVDEIIDFLLYALPDLARFLIQDSRDISEKINKKFFDNPDDPLEHEPKWHQWGIITHTRMFDIFHKNEVAKYLDDWGVMDFVMDKMSQKIDGMEKYSLLNISIPLHDLGKFVVRKTKMEDSGSISYSFKGHEIASGKLIRENDVLSVILRHGCGLTDAQMEYIARCAELHYVLGIMRDRAKKLKVGYSFEFARNSILFEWTMEIIKNYPDFAIEIGILFLADCLAKTGIHIKADNGAEIEAQDLLIREMIWERELDERLVDAVKQFPISLEVVKIYLQTLAMLSAGREWEYGEY